MGPQCRRLAGRLKNCVVSVHLGYAAGEFHALLDGELYLPEETWHEDRARCRKAGIPDEGVYRAKWKIALGQIQRALGNGVRFAWLTFDEGYGGKPTFLREIDALGQHDAGGIPSSFVGPTPWRPGSVEIAPGSVSRVMRSHAQSACKLKHDRRGRALTGRRTPRPHLRRSPRRRPRAPSRWASR